MTTTLIAALALGLLAPLVRAFSWGVPFSLLSIGTVLATSFGSVVSVLVIGATVSVLLRASGLSAEQVDALAGGVATVGGFVLLLSSARRMRHVRGLSVLCQRLAEEDARPMAHKALARLLDHTARKDPERYVALVLMATGPLTQASLWAEARTRLEDLPTDALSAEQSILRDQALATCALQFDDTKTAQEAIGRIARPADPSIEVWLVAMEALVLAVTGDAEGAAKKLRSQETRGNPSLEASHRLVHAHIFAGQGRREHAREELEAVQRAAGPVGLVRALHPRGPASEIAQELLATAEAASPA